MALPAASGIGAKAPLPPTTATTTPTTTAPAQPRPDTLGAQAGAETAAVTGAETAAEVAPPEAVIPAVAAAAAAKHIEHQYHPSKLANQVSAAQAPRPTPPGSPAAPRQELGQDTVASRAAPS